MPIETRNIAARLIKHHELGPSDVRLRLQGMCGANTFLQFLVPLGTFVHRRHGRRLICSNLYYRSLITFAVSPAFRLRFLSF